MYVNIIRKGSVGLFQKNFASISETQIKKQKKQVRIKELENRDEAKRKGRSCFNFFIRTFLKQSEKISGKTAKQERLDKTIVEK